MNIFRWPSYPIEMYKKGSRILCVETYETFDKQTHFTKGKIYISRGYTKNNYHLTVHIIKDDENNEHNGWNAIYFIPLSALSKAGQVLYAENN